MAIDSKKVQLITEAHALGYLDPAIVRYAGVSLATVKRYRDLHGLPTNCVTAKRGRLGEKLVAAAAAAQGLPVRWHERERDGYDLVINGQRVDAKAASRLANGSWRFRLPRTRPSLCAQYRYAKDYAADCEVLALVALDQDETRAPDIYLFESDNLPLEIRIRRHGIYEAFRNDWTLLEASSTPMLA